MRSPSQETDPLVSGGRLGKQRAPDVPSFLRLLLMTSFNFPMAVIWSTMALIVLPAEALWLFPTDESFFLGVFLVIVGLSQLVCPVVGLISDRHKSPYGRRRPFIIAGAVLSFAGVGILWGSSVHRQGWFYIVGLLFSMIALNIIYSAQASIVPDFYDERKGEASGIVAALTASGNLFGMVYVVAYSEADIHTAYGFYLVMLAGTTALVVLAVDEVPTDEAAVRPITWREIFGSFYLDIARYRDFFWVCVGRTFYYMSTSCLTFMYFYLRDDFNLESESAIRATLAQIVTVAMLVGIACSCPLGWISDVCGRKPLVYVACVVMAVVYMGFLGSPWLGPERGLVLVYFLGALYGVASSCYQSVDYALALDCLPSVVDRMAESADAEADRGAGGGARAGGATKGDGEALGLWGIAGFVGSSLGPLAGGAALETLGGWGHRGYTYEGYVALLSLSAVYALAAAFVTRFIVGAR